MQYLWCTKYELTVIMRQALWVDIPSCWNSYVKLSYFQYSFSSVGMSNDWRGSSRNNIGTAHAHSFLAWSGTTGLGKSGHIWILPSWVFAIWSNRHNNFSPKLCDQFMLTDIIHHFRQCWERTLLALPFLFFLHPKCQKQPYATSSKRLSDYAKLNLLNIQVWAKSKHYREICNRWINTEAEFVIDGTQGVRVVLLLNSLLFHKFLFHKFFWVPLLFKTPNSFQIFLSVPTLSFSFQIPKCTTVCWRWFRFPIWSGESSPVNS